MGTVPVCHLSFLFQDITVLPGRLRNKACFFVFCCARSACWAGGGAGCCVRTRTGICTWRSLCVESVCACTHTVRVPVVESITRRAHVRFRTVPVCTCTCSGVNTVSRYSVRKNRVGTSHHSIIINCSTDIPVPAVHSTSTCTQYYVALCFVQ